VVPADLDPIYDHRATSRVSSHRLVPPLSPAPERRQPFLGRRKILLPKSRHRPPIVGVRCGRTMRRTVVPGSCTGDSPGAGAARPPDGSANGRDAPSEPGCTPRDVNSVRIAEPGI